MAKPLRGHSQDLPAGRVRRAAHVKAEMDQAHSHRLSPETPSSANTEHTATGITEQQHQLVTDSVFTPLSLGHFIKTSVYETEQFVQREYEIVDANGQLLQGRRARQNLRHGKDENAQSIEGFEVI
jgi:hypothetical protein